MVVIGASIAVTGGDGTATVLSVVGSGVSLAVLAGVFGLPTSILATSIALLPAYLLGKVLRSVRDERIHLAIFAMYGLLVGVATVAVFTAGMAFKDDSMRILWAVLVLLAGVVVPFGQHRAVRRAFQADAEAEHSAASPVEGSA
jgi:hypothetical protein